jgi:hypothetical protein
MNNCTFNFDVWDKIECLCVNLHSNPVEEFVLSLLGFNIIFLLVDFGHAKFERCLHFGHIEIESHLSARSVELLKDQMPNRFVSSD